MALAVRGRRAPGGERHRRGGVRRPTCSLPLLEAVLDLSLLAALPRGRRSVRAAEERWTCGSVGQWK
eukprot:scaffold1307_cov200-Pinguiococcus_pyrenoidosus.AAC.149